MIATLPSAARARGAPLLYVALAILALLDVLILGVRFAAMLPAGNLRLLSEGTGLYAIWKIRHAHPLYEWPLSPPYPVTYYNFLFYRFYGAVFSLFHVPDVSTPIAGRILTLALAAAGGAAQYQAARRLLGRRGLRLLCLLLAVIAWTGAVLPGVWAYTVRPDIGSVAFAVLGVYLSLRAFDTGDGNSLVWAGAAFFAAWAFKQTNVGIFAATVLYTLLWRRSLRESMRVVLPWAFGVAAVFAIGGAAYRENILVVPGLNALIPSSAPYWYGTTLFSNALIWAAALAALVLRVRRGRDAFGGVDLTYPILAAACCFVIDTVSIMKVGSALNHVLDLNCMCALLTTAVLGMAVANEARRATAFRVLAAAAVLPMIGSSLARVARERPAIVGALRGTSRDVVDRRAIERVVASLPRPFYSEDDAFALPWFSTGGAYPAVIRDPIFHDAAQPKGLLGAGVDGLIRERRFAAILVPPSSPRLSAALNAGYMPVDVGLPPSAGLQVLLRRSP